jgi:hypothetical protein
MASDQRAGHPRPDGKAEEEPIAGAIGDDGNAASRDAGTREPDGHYSRVS